MVELCRGVVFYLLSVNMLADTTETLKRRALNVNQHNEHQKEKLVSLKSQCSLNRLKNSLGDLKLVFQRLSFGTC